MTIKMQTTVNGPFFREGIDVDDVTKKTITEVVLTGEGMAKQMAQPSPEGLFRTRAYAAANGYFQTGHYNRSINGRVVNSMHGLVTDSNVVYGPWLEGISSRNQTTRFKGYSIFRKTTQMLQKKAQGILDKHVRNAVKRVG